MAPSSPASPSPKTAAPKKHMTPAELQAFIAASPKHKRVVSLYTPILVLGFVSCLWVLVSLGTSVGFGWAVVQEHRWLLFHYTSVALLSLCHAAFCWRFRVDIEALEDPSQFQIDIGRIVITSVVQQAFLVYLYIKLKTYADEATFRLRCDINCPSKLKWMRVSPLLTALLLLLFLLPQLWLSLILFHNPVLNPPPEKLKQLADEEKAEHARKDREEESDLDDHSEGEEKKGLIRGHDGIHEREEMSGAGEAKRREKSLARGKRERRSKARR